MHSVTWAAVGLLAAAAEAAPRHVPIEVARGADVPAGQESSLGKGFGIAPLGLDRLAGSGTAARSGFERHDRRAAAVDDGCVASRIIVSTTTVDVTVYVTETEEPCPYESEEPEPCPYEEPASSPATRTATATVVPFTNFNEPQRGSPATSYRGAAPSMVAQQPYKAPPGVVNAVAPLTQPGGGPVAPQATVSITRPFGTGSYNGNGAGPNPSVTKIVVPVTQPVGPNFGTGAYEPSVVPFRDLPSNSRGPFPGDSPLKSKGPHGGDGIIAVPKPTYGPGNGGPEHGGPGGFGNGGPGGPGNGGPGGPGYGGPGGALEPTYTRTLLLESHIHSTVTSFKTAPSAAGYALPGSNQGGGRSPTNGGPGSYTGSNGRSPSNGSGGPLNGTGSYDSSNGRSPANGAAGGPTYGGAGNYGLGKGRSPANGAAGNPTYGGADSHGLDKGQSPANGAAGNPTYGGAGNYSLGKGQSPSSNGAHEPSHGDGGNYNGGNYNGGDRRSPSNAPNRGAAGYGTHDGYTASRNIAAQSPSEDAPDIVQFDPSASTKPPKVHKPVPDDNDVTTAGGNNIIINGPVDDNDNDAAPIDSPSTGGLLGGGSNNNGEGKSGLLGLGILGIL
ncbi:hypothetical protein HIM_07022 [Hirsutella minnesotensis 3608]|uniref:Uncharacterized protein n=1 Tax=Hirsutella minnesotensis 3608 TaxID=1043627 RepID=A0A0F7ZI67_9HYPO|nr:hypothetical protein HIM_07022 [Hirsutella minnesotensis 3608]